MPPFIALQRALELARELGPLIAQIQTHDRDLALQLRRAAASIPSCLSEGSRRSGRDRLQLYRTSSGSTAEVLVQLQLAVAWGYLEAEKAERALALLDEVGAMTWRLTQPRKQ